MGLRERAMQSLTTTGGGVAQTVIYYFVPTRLKNRANII